MTTITPTTKPFPFAVRLGIVFIVQSASLSALAVTTCLLYLAYSAIRGSRGRMWQRSSPTQIHWYFLCLLISDLIQAIGGIMSIRWITKAGVEAGSFCTAQGLFKQMGDVGVALTSMVIALHTFFVLVFHWSPSRAVAILVVTTIWVFIALVVGISVATHRGQGYYGNTQYWCWITSKYPVQRIALEYAWMWLACFVNIVVYVFLALVVKGIVVVEKGKLRFPARKDRVSARLAAHRGGSREAGANAMQLLFYPAVYIITVLPVAFARWYTFTGHRVPFTATAFASVLFSSSGFLNVILFKLTRPTLLSNTDGPRLSLLVEARSIRTRSAVIPVVQTSQFSGSFDGYRPGIDNLSDEPQASTPSLEKDPVGHQV